MIPSFIKIIPTIFQNDTEAIMFANWMDTQIASWKSDILGLELLQDVDRCPGQFLSYLGYILGTQFDQNDSEQTKRIKIANTIKNLKYRSTWINDCKIKIDAITGLDAELYTSDWPNIWGELGNGILENFSKAAHWAEEEGTGTLTQGILELATNTELETPGNIYIDAHYGVHTSTLTAGQITQIDNAIRYDCVPCFFIVHLGYVDGSGNFQTYEVIQ